MPHGAGLYLSAPFQSSSGECRVIFLRVMGLLCLIIFFHFSDGKHTFTDAAGVELNGIAAARAHAIAQIHEMRAAQSERAL